MNTNTAHTSITSALAAAQARFAPVRRTRTVRVQTKSGAAYTFSYAPLEEILAATIPALAAEGIAVTQRLETDPPRLTTILCHAAGEIRSSIPWREPPEPGPQALGSALTYARRYCLSLALCVAPEDDDDAGAAEGHTTVPLPRKQPTSLSDAQRQELSLALTAIGIEQEAKLAWCAQVVGRPLKTSGDLLVSDLPALKAAVAAPKVPS